MPISLRNMDTKILNKKGLMCIQSTLKGFIYPVVKRGCDAKMISTHANQ